MAKFITDNIHWIVILIGVVAVLAYTTAKSASELAEGKTKDNKTNKDEKTNA